MHLLFNTLESFRTKQEDASIPMMSKKSVLSRTRSSCFSESTIVLVRNFDWFMCSFPNENCNVEIYNVGYMFILVVCGCAGGGV